MLYNETILNRLSECGLHAGEMLQIPPHIGWRFLAGEGVLLTIEHSCPCQKCGGKDHAVFFVEREKVPAWITAMLRASAKRRTKKS